MGCAGHPLVQTPVLDALATHSTRFTNAKDVGTPKPERPILSEYHAAGAVSGAFMLRCGRWKYHHYVGFVPDCSISTKTR